MNLAILQARIGSTRLPGKNMMKLGDKTMIQHCVDRIKQSALIDKLVVAIPDTEENDIIEQLCESLGVDYFRGNESDCLDRFYMCARKYSADVIIRCTADCPLIDPEVIDQCIEYFFNCKQLYVKNTWYHNSYPSGYDVEVFRFNALEKHWTNEVNIPMREHVLSSFYPKTYYPQLTDQYNFEINNLHLSVDTQADFDLVQNIIEELGGNCSFKKVMAYLNDNPSLTESNLTDKRYVIIKKLKSK
jgi:spore coat polysaccharide biosynthesis protein SpsF